MSENTQTIAPKKKNAFNRLWVGDEPLSVVYWYYGVLIGDIFSLITHVIIKETGMGIFTVPFMIYAVFIGISIWRSCNNYKGRTIWRILARIVACLDVVIGCSVLINIIIALCKILLLKFMSS